MQTINDNPVWTGTSKSILVILLVVMFTIASWAGLTGQLANTTHSIFPPVAITVVIPVALFLLAYAVSSRFRQFILSQDIRLLTTMQLWRVIGFAFLPLYFFSILPGLFGLVAGLGDVAIGLAAVYVVSRLNAEPEYLLSKGFLRLHYFGMLDFVGALGTAALTSGAVPQLITNGVTSAAMDVWPLNLFPSFIVPCFIILHLCVLLKVRHLRQNEKRSLDAHMA